MLKRSHGEALRLHKEKNVHLAIPAPANKVILVKILDGMK
jgi:hypothetical protein